MKCPICGEETKVIDSRPFYGTIKRRRECLSCSYRFTTEELKREDAVQLLRVLNHDEFNEALDELENATSLCQLERAKYRLLDICNKCTKIKGA